MSKAFVFEPEARQAFLTNLLEKGPITDGFPSEPCNPSDIPWVDYELIRNGQKFRKKYFATVHMAESVAQVLGFIAKQIPAPTFSSLSSAPACQKRFLSTKKVLEFDWFESDFKSDAFIRSIKRVRNFHKAKARPKTCPVIQTQGYAKEYRELVEAVKKDLEFVKIPPEYPEKQMAWNPTMFFSQMDLAFVMLTYAPVILYPEKLGIYMNSEDMEGAFGVMHGLAVIGRLLGLRDEFNIALYPDLELLQQLENMLLLPALKTMDQAVAFALYRAGFGHWGRSTLGLVTPKVVLQFLYDAKGVEGEELWKTMGLKDRTAYRIGKKVVQAQRWGIVRAFSNKFVKLGLRLEIYLFHK